jgi:glycosyltransferase involved in cell wall biosynthesis
MISVVVPVYNEEDGVDKVLDQVHAVMGATGEPYEVLVVDDGSTDGSAAVLRKRTDITLLSHHVNGGYGRALKTGIAAARGEWIAILDADATYPVGALTALIKDREGYDMVVGARVGARNISLPRRIGQSVMRLLVRLLVRVHVPDLNSGLRIFRRELAEDFWGLLPDGFSFTTTISVAALSAQRRVRYVTIDYHKRVGKSSINPVTDFHNFLMLIVMTATYFRPLKFYVPVSYALFVVAVLRGIRDVIVLDRLAGLTVILVMLSMQVWFFGLLADIVVKRTEHFRARRMERERRDR